MERGELPPFPAPLLASVDPLSPCPGAPGSLLKQAALHVRALLGLPLYHPDDDHGPPTPCDYSHLRKPRVKRFTSKGRVYPCYHRFVAWMGKQYLGYAKTEAEAWERVHRYLERRQAAA